jgi:hypothetical protein
MFFLLLSIERAKDPGACRKKKEIDEGTFSRAVYVIQLESV